MSIDDSDWARWIRYPLPDAILHQRTPSFSFRSSVQNLRDIWIPCRNQLPSYKMPAYRLMDSAPLTNRQAKLLRLTGNLGCEVSENGRLVFCVKGFYHREKGRSQIRVKGSLGRLFLLWAEPKLWGIGRQTLQFKSERRVAIASLNSPPRTMRIAGGHEYNETGSIQRSLCFAV